MMLCGGNCFSFSCISSVHLVSEDFGHFGIRGFWPYYLFKSKHIFLLVGNDLILQSPLKSYSVKKKKKLTKLCRLQYIFIRIVHNMVSFLNVIRICPLSLHINCVQHINVIISQSHFPPQNSLLFPGTYLVQQRKVSLESD